MLTFAAFRKAAMEAVEGLVFFSMATPMFGHAASLPDAELNSFFACLLLVGVPNKLFDNRSAEGFRLIRLKVAERFRVVCVGDINVFDDQ